MVITFRHLSTRHRSNNIIDIDESVGSEDSVDKEALLTVVVAVLMVIGGGMGAERRRRNWRLAIIIGTLPFFQFNYIKNKKIKHLR